VVWRIIRWSDGELAHEVASVEETVAKLQAQPLPESVIREVEETGITMPYVVHYDEHAPGLLETWQHPHEAEKYVHALKRIMEEYAAKGNAILVGRGAHFILKDADALHIRLVADMSYRIQRVMEVRWVNEAPAKEIIRQNDHDRAAFHRHYFRADW